jgi:hypothetical protein
MSGLFIVIGRPSVVLSIAIAVVVVLLWIRLRRDQFYALLAGVVVALVLGEILCRILGLGAPQPYAFRESRTDPGSAVHPYEPNTELVYEYPDNPRGYFGEGNQVIGHINALGFRGREPGGRGPDAPLRIAMLGDSFALGFGVRDEDTLPAQLERELRARSRDVEVLNFGASGTGTRNQVDLLESFVLGFDPDVVVILFFLNDTGRVGTNTLLSERLTLGRLRARSYFVNAVATAVERAVVTRRMIQHYVEGFEDSSPGWVEARDALRRAQGLARAEDFDLIVAVHPVLFRLDESYPFEEIHRTIAEFCRAEGIEHIDLLDVFMGQSDKDMWVHRTDHHPNELAHGMSAAFLAERLDRDVLDRRAANPGVLGVGNGYLQDILFAAGIHPRRKAVDLSAPERRALHKATRAVLGRAVTLGGRGSERDLYGRPGGYQRILHSETVGRPCPECGTPIRKIQYLGGASCFCPRCQTE